MVRARRSRFGGDDHDNVGLYLAEQDVVATFDPLPVPAQRYGPPDEILSIEESAEFLGTTAKALERRRARGTGPEYVKVGRFVVYRQSALMRWRAAQRAGSKVEPTG